jgi:hypothetical protein
MHINKTYTGRSNTKTGVPNLFTSRISVTPSLPEGKTELRSFMLADLGIEYQTPKLLSLNIIRDKI